MTVEDAPSSEEEDEEKENMPPQSAWNEHTHDPPPPHFTEQCGSNLPHHRTMTELGYLRCFLPDSVTHSSLPSPPTRLCTPHRRRQLLGGLRHQRRCGRSSPSTSSWASSASHPFHM